MDYLLDANVISELVRPKPEAVVLDWFMNTPDDALLLSALMQLTRREDSQRLTCFHAASNSTCTR